MSTRPAFDPRTDLRAERHGTSLMSVYLDGAERIEQGLVIRGSDPLVALRACPSCDLFECELVEGYAASVRRFGPYVLWFTAWDEDYCFALDRYREVFGGDVESLAEPRDREYPQPEPARSGDFRCPDGRTLSYDVDRAPDEPLARLSAWPALQLPGLEAVPPPATAIELPSLVAGARSLWIDEHPRSDGRRAAFLPDVCMLRVWLVGPEVDQVVAAALGPTSP
jgi:hypothetical protein